MDAEQLNLVTLVINRRMSMFASGIVTVIVSMSRRETNYRHLRVYRDRNLMLDSQAFYVNMGFRKKHRKYIKDFPSARVMLDSNLVVLHEFN